MFSELVLSTLEAPKIRATCIDSDIVALSLGVVSKLIAKTSDTVAESVGPKLRIKFRASETFTILFLFTPDSVAKASLALAVSSKA